MVKNTGRFKRGHLNVRRIEVTAIRAAAAAQDKRRRARLGVYRAAGTLANKRVFATVEPGAGRPDGATVDAEGYFWSARIGGAARKKRSFRRGCTE